MEKSIPHWESKIKFNEEGWEQGQLRVKCNIEREMALSVFKLFIVLVNYQLQISYKVQLPIDSHFFS